MKIKDVPAAKLRLIPPPKQAAMGYKPKSYVAKDAFDKGKKKK